MQRVLRGHHLLCVHGFKGMGYSPEFIVKMADIVKDVRDVDKDFEIVVVADFDEACGVCPHQGATECEAGEGSNEHVLSMDWKVLDQLGLVHGQAYLKSSLLRLTREKVQPADLDYLCAGCSWLAYGVCKEGIAKLQS